ncbi:glycosyltransferase family 2 protein [Bacillus spizizenii]|nr:glycosyltransferase family 2 protein [Bacillus spizizenii]
MKFSVAIPVYNDQNSIKTCLDSVLNQTIGQDRLEIICVNDGSTDESGAILDEYMSKYPCIKVIHQENSGAPGRPRNKAIDIATGDYIYFVDGDDYLGIEALERMEEKILEYQSDIVIGRYEGINRGVPVSIFKRNPDCFSFFGSNALFTTSAQKLFKLDLLKKHNIRFPEHFSLGEDQPFIIQAYAYSNSIALVKDYECYYLTNHQTVGRVQLTKKPLSGKLFMLRIEETLAAIEALELDKDKKLMVFHQYWERVLDVELSALISRSFLVEDKLYIFNTFKKVLDKYHYLDYYSQFSSRQKLLIRLIDKGKMEDLIAFWYAEKHTGNMVVFHGQVYPKPKMAYELALNESISFHRLNKFEGEITRLERLENTLLLEGFCYHSHVDSSNENLFIEISLRGQQEEGITLPAFRNIYEKHHPIEIESHYLKKERVTYFHTFIPIQSLFRFNQEGDILDVRLISKIEDYTKSVRLRAKPTVLLKESLFISKEHTEWTLLSTYLTKWGNLSFVLKTQELDIQNFSLSYNNSEVKGYFSLPSSVSLDESSRLQLIFSKFLTYEPEVILQKSSGSEQLCHFRFAVSKSDLKQLRQKKNVEIAIGHYKKRVPVYYKERPSIIKRVLNKLRRLFI